MSKKFLGDTFDIHGGGQDLIFPHHENELAQSEGANEKPFVTTWIHHGFVTIKDEKMSKSLGNFLTIRDITANYHPEELRFFVFSTHYRNPLDFSENAMQDAITGLDRLYDCIASIESLGDGAADGKSVISEKDKKKLEALEDRFRQAMDNDFNTAQAQGVLFDIAKVFNKIYQMLPSIPAASDISLLRSRSATFKQLAGIMGLLQEDAAAYISRKRAKMLEAIDIDEDTINALIEERYAARNAKNWSRSDEIRDQLLNNNIELKDSADGTTWSVKSDR
jgi:cysteinyl-tRNA synthetase